MFKALNTAASGMDAQQRKLDILANNMANVSTTGFKASRVEFQELLYQRVRNPGDTDQGGSPTGIEVGTGVRTAATEKSFSQGAFEATERPLDIAIEGDGFFRVLQENGEYAYTRAGSFKVDATGRMVTANGLELTPSIVIPDDAVSIDIGRDGRVHVVLADDSSSLEIGQIELVRFPNAGGLNAHGRGLFTVTEASGQEQIGIPGENGMGALTQGFLESSNVQVVEEMVSMIVSQRAYEINSKVIRTADEMLRSATNIR